MGTYTEILYQVVFGTKNHQNFLNQNNEDKLYAYIAGTCKSKNCTPFKIGGNKNHIHMIISLIPKMSLSNLVKEIKNASTWMIKDNFSEYSEFNGWMDGYSAFTYQKSARNSLVRYVENQAIHHKKISFYEELISLYKDFGIEFNPKYIMQ